MNGFKPSDLLTLAPDERRVMTWLIRRGEGSLAEIEQHLGLPNETVLRLVEALRQRGLITACGEATPGRFRARLGSTPT